MNFNDNLKTKIYIFKILALPLFSSWANYLRPFQCKRAYSQFVPVLQTISICKIAYIWQILLIENSTWLPFYKPQFSCLLVILQKLSKEWICHSRTYFMCFIRILSKELTNRLIWISPNVSSARFRVKNLVLFEKLIKSIVSVPLVQLTQDQLCKTVNIGYIPVIMFSNKSSDFFIELETV